MSRPATPGGKTARVSRAGNPSTQLGAGTSGGSGKVLAAKFRGRIFGWRREGGMSSAALPGNFLGGVSTGMKRRGVVVSLAPVRGEGK